MKHGDRIRAYAALRAVLAKSGGLAEGDLAAWTAAAAVVDKAVVQDVVAVELPRLVGEGLVEPVPGKPWLWRRR